MKKYLLISNGYPSNEDKYNNGFVHTRVKNYKEKKLDIDVFYYSKKRNDDFIYDGVDVLRGNSKKLQTLLESEKYEKVLIHFAFSNILKVIEKSAPNIPVVIWVHGTEALGWYRRLFALDFKRLYRFIGYIILNSYQLYYLRKFIKNKKINKKFIFVSEWMMNIMKTDTLTKNIELNYDIIPNVVDEKIFSYSEKSADDRLKILSIRPYQSKKYANDLMVKAILLLRKEKFFNELSFTIYGDGRLFDSVLKPLRGLDNVSIHRGFLSHADIKVKHDKNGIMLIPTRQDAQGVSMCEAISSGLVAVTSNNTAIPEYVDGSFGFLTNNHTELAGAIKQLYLSPDLYLKMSKKGSDIMQKRCSSSAVINDELKVIKNNI